MVYVAQREVFCSDFAWNEYPFVHEAGGNHFFDQAEKKSVSVWMPHQER